MTVGNYGSAFIIWWLQLIDMTSITVGNHGSAFVIWWLQHRYNQHNVGDYWFSIYPWKLQLDMTSIYYHNTNK